MGQRLDDMERRLAALEQRLSGAGGSTDTGVGAPTDAPDEPLWALKALQRRLAGTDGSGAVMFTGTWAPEAGSTPVQWQYGRATEDILGWDWAELAPTLAALGSPVRLGLLHQILTGTQDTAALTAAEGLGTSGQLHHHLRILVAAGWLRSPGRGRYEVPGSRIIPLMALLMAAEDR